MKIIINQKYNSIKSQKYTNIKYKSNIKLN